MPRKGHKSMCASFVGAYEVVSDWFEEDKPLWPDERELRKAIYTHRVRIKPMAKGLVSLPNGDAQKPKKTNTKRNVEK